jgi:TusE/DsrC/DsvC family sulfur relay protein
MPQTTIAGHTIDVNDEGFLTRPEQWDEELAGALAKYAGVQEMTERHWAPVKFLRDDYAKTGQTATLRRVASVGGFEIKDLFVLFPGKPAKKMAYIAGLPKPKGCV